MVNDQDKAAWLRRELIDIVREEVGVNEMFATLAGEVLLFGIRRRLGGREIYIPAPDTRARDEAIREAFNGRNLQDVMRQFGVGRNTIYRACRKT